MKANLQLTGLRWLPLGLLLIVADQITKYYAVKHLTYGVPVPVLEPVLNWTLVHNMGGAFSFLRDSGGWQHWFFVSVALGAGIAIPIWLSRLAARQTWLCLALAMIWSGAVGNLIDRLRFRYVIDFIQVHWHDSWYYPVFNVADSAITVGAICLVIYEVFLAKREPK